MSDHWLQPKLKGGSMLGTDEDNFYLCMQILAKVFILFFIVQERVLN